MAAHRKISRINHPGYCPRRCCAACGRAATKTAPYVCCDGETGCPNVCHITCLGDRETYACTETQQLRLEANVDAEVTYVEVSRHDHTSENGDTPAAAALPSLPPEVDDEVDTEEVDNERQQYLEMEKEELVTYTLSFKHEVSRQKTIIQPLTLQRDWIIDCKSQVKETLQLMEALSDAREADEKRTTCTVATSAIAKSIDNAWERACSSNPAARTWWESDLPRRLQACRLETTQPTPPTNTAATFTASSNPPNPPSPTGDPPSRLSSTSTNTESTNTASAPAPTVDAPTTTSPRNRSQTNTSVTDTGPGSSRTNNSGGRRTRGRKKKTGTGANRPLPTYPPPLLPGPHYPPRTQPTAQPRSSRPTCQYCLRPGHVIDNCFTRAADAREESLLRRVLAESRVDKQPPHRNHHHSQAPFRDSTRYSHWEEQPRYSRDWPSPPWGYSHPSQ